MIHKTVRFGWGGINFIFIDYTHIYKMYILCTLFYKK